MSRDQVPRKNRCGRFRVCDNKPPRIVSRLTIVPFADVTLLGDEFDETTDLAAIFERERAEVP